jgi:hypothetical protein
LAISDDRLSDGRLVSTKKSAEKLHHAPPVEVDNNLVVLHALTSFHGTQVPQKAVMTIAHPSQSAALEHTPRMHFFAPLPRWARHVRDVRLDSMLAAASTKAVNVFLAR